MAQAVAESTMKLAEIKAALVKAAEGDGDEAAEAKKMLSALFGDEKKDDEKAEASDDKKDEEKKDDEKAEASDDKKDEEKKDEDAKASASAIARVGVLEREVASMKALREKGERDALLASRTDLTEGQIKLLAAQPLDQMRRTLAAFPAATPSNALTGVRSKTPTQGSLQTSANDLRMATNLSPHAEMLDRQMGLSKPAAAITKEGDKLVCRTMTPTQAREHLKKIEARESAQGTVK